MRRDIPQWVISYCGHWGSQKRRIWTGMTWHINSAGEKVYDIDGYASSMLGRIREEQEGAAQGAIHQYWAEVMWGHGIEVQRSLPGMPESPLLAGHLHYVWPKDCGLTIPQKAALIELDKNQYWDSLRNFEWWVFARLNPASDCQPKQNHLQAVPKAPTFRANSYEVPKSPPKKVDFSALKRPTLSLRVADPEEAA